MGANGCYCKSNKPATFGIFMWNDDGRATTHNGAICFDCALYSARDINRYVATHPTLTRVWVGRWRNTSKAGGAR